ncbi:MAG: hypothetical protein P8P29_05505 [Flavobacteriaceae bacterium]|nr:hypothetical protein [Flavobacteriaceae bacterium]
MNHQAIFNLYPNVVSVDDTAGAMDKDGNQVPIVQSDYETEVARLQAEQDATQYQRDRQVEYPSIDELIVALWEGVVEERMASVTALEGLRQAVKTKHPKP